MTTLIPKFQQPTSTAVNRAINLKLQETVSLEDFGAKGDGTTNDTAAITAAINYANTNYLTLTGPDGVYIVTPGVLPVLTTSMIAPTAFFKAANDTDSYLLAINYTGSLPAISNDTAASVLDLGGFADSTGSTYKGTGLLVKGCARATVTIRKAINLNYGIYLDGSNNPTNAMFESTFNLKTDSCNYGLYITTGNSGAGVAIDTNVFNMNASFNHKTACVTIVAGTVQVHNNVFNQTDLELGQTNSNGYVFSGAAVNNRIFIYLQRGRNGTGKYITTNVNSSNNYWYVAQWVAADNSFGSVQQVNALDASNGATPALGRSLFFAPDIATAVGTNIPSQVGDIIFRNNPNIGDNLAWICTTAGIVGSGAIWTAFGMKVSLFCGMSDAVTGVSAGTTRYFPVMGSTQSTANNSVAQQTTADGVLRYFRVRSSAAPTAGESFVFTLVKNNIITAITLTISGANTSATSLATTLSVAAGDSLAWEVVSSASTPANTVVFASFQQLVDPT